jgi:two-component system response regulator FlrC
VVQERQLVRLGGERPVDLDVRVVAATNRDLRSATASREFREDLYFRLSTFKLRVPPLRERRGDILPLVARLLVRHADGGRVLSLSADAQACLHAHDWPGNVRELENVVMRALVLCTGEVIHPAHLMFDEPAAPAGPAVAAAAPEDSAASAARAAPAEVHEPVAMHPVFVPSEFSAPDLESEALPANLQQAVQMNEQQLIMAAIQSTYSRMEAARKLGISPRTLRYKLAKLKGNGLALSV